MSVDAILLFLVLLISFYISLDYWYWPKDGIFWIILGAPFLAIPIFASFKLYQSVIRYIGSSALWSVVQAVTLYALAWGLLSYMSSVGGIQGVSGIPRSVILINWMLTIIVIGGIRLFARWVFSDETFVKSPPKNNVIIYGAGSAGRQLARALQLSSEYLQIAYIDDDPSKDKAYINNIPVYSSQKLEQIISKFKISEVLLALPSISRKNRKKIIEKLRPFPVHVRSLPSVSELAEGKVKIDDLLEVDIRDLLGREQVKPNQSLLKTNITNNYTHT